MSTTQIVDTAVQHLKMQWRHQKVLVTLSLISTAILSRPVNPIIEVILTKQNEPNPNTWVKRMMTFNNSILQASEKRKQKRIKRFSPLNNNIGLVHSLLENQAIVAVEVA